MNNENKELEKKELEENKKDISESQELEEKKKNKGNKIAIITLLLVLGPIIITVLPSMVENSRLAFEDFLLESFILYFYTMPIALTISLTYRIKYKDNPLCNFAFTLTFIVAVLLIVALLYLMIWCSTQEPQGSCY